MRILLVVLAVAVVVTGCSAARTNPQASLRPADLTPPAVGRRTLPAPVLVRVTSAVSTAAPVVLHHRPGRWRQVLRTLDRHRARAWDAGEPGRLRRVYVPDSPALRRDQRMLRAYVERGLTVRGVRTTYQRVRVHERGPRRVVLDVLDRLRGRPVARDTAGHQRRLPRDRPDRHLVELQKVDGRWRIATITTITMPR